MRLRCRLIVFLLIACALPSAFAAPPESAPREAGMVVKLTGAARVHRNGHARLLTLYSPLYVGDVLTLAPASAIVVRDLYGRCKTVLPTSPTAVRRIASPVMPDGNAAARLRRVLFDDQERALTQADMNARTAVRGGPDPVPPLTALLPRGKTLADRIVFRWTMQTSGPVAVTLQDAAGTMIWTQSGLTDGHLAYPATAPALAPGKAYAWSVSDGRSEDDAQASFETVSLDEARQLRQRIAAVDALSFADDSERLLSVASVLMDGNYWSSAAEMLQSRLDTGTPGASGPTIHALLSLSWQHLQAGDMAQQERNFLAQQHASVPDWSDDGF